MMNFAHLKKGPFYTIFRMAWLRSKTRAEQVTLEKRETGGYMLDVAKCTS